jgi:hypothetical protein
MADEADVARLTKQIAEAMLDARRALQDVATDLDVTKLPRTLERRLESVEDLEASVGRLEDRETESAAANGVPATREAHGLLQDSFKVAKETSGNLAFAIRSDRNNLAAHGAAMTDSAKGLDAGLKDVDALEKLSGGETETTTKLRDGLNGLKTAALNVRAGTRLAEQKLDTAQTAADQLANADPPVDIHRRHSAAIAFAASTVRAQVTNTGAVLENLRRDVYGGEAAREEATAHGVHTAEAAAEAATAAADRETTNPEAAHTGSFAGQLDPELAHAINAGFTPSPAAGTAAPATPRDPRLPYMLPPRGHEAASHQDDRDNGR